MLITKLKDIELDLPKMLEDSSIWNSLDIDYYPPRVERLWAQYSEGRICLHAIHKCNPDEALYHPHPWPSSMKVLEGNYRMGLSDEVGTSPYPNGGDYSRLGEFLHTQGFKLREIATVELSSGSYYEMPEEKGWHYVQPLDDVVYTLMYIGQPFKNKSNGAKKADKDLKRLPEERVSELLLKFKELCNG